MSDREIEAGQAAAGISLTRRRFSSTIAAAIGGGALLGASSAPFIPKSHHPRRNSLGIALVGLGNYSAGQLAPALRETEHCHLAGIVTGTPAKADSWLEQYPQLEGHVYDYSSYDKLADDDAIDIVYVVLPNSMHAEYTIRAAAAGKHVICEKPMAVTAAEAQTMIDACEAAGRSLHIGYRLHFEPHNVEAMRISSDRDFGRITYAQTEFGFRLGGSADQWRLRKSLGGGGALMDVGIYAIQAARYVMGVEPVSVTAQETKTDPVRFSEVDETITWQLRFPDDGIASSQTSYATRTERLFAAGESGWLELRPAFVYGGIAGKTSRGPMDFPQVNQQARHMDGVASAILSGKTLHIDGYEGLRDMRVIDAIYESIRTGRAVAI